MKLVRNITLALLAIVSNAKAQDFLAVENVGIPQNGQANLTITFHFEEPDLYTGYQLDIVLPDGIDFIKDDKGRITYSAGDCHEESHNISMNYNEDDNILKVACLSLESEPLYGTSGVLITIPIQADESLNAGVQLTGFLQNVALATLDAQSIVIPNIQFNITIDDPDDGYIKFNEDSTTLPTYTAGEKGNVRMTRSITAGKWSTIVLPFTLTKTKAEAVFGSDVQLAEFSGFEVDYGDDEENVVPFGITLIFSTYTMTAKKSMTGGKPFLIKTTKNITSFEANDCSLVDAVTDVNKTDEYDTMGKFTGSFVKTKIPADGLFISNNKFWYSTGKTDIKAFRGWFELGAVLNKETNFEVKMLVMIDDEETRVEGLNGKQLEHDAIYDLSGRKVSKPKQRGIYIVDGKKTLIR